MLIRLVAGSKSSTESMMTASCVEGSETMYCHVAVTGSKQVNTSGVMYLARDMVLNACAGFCCDCPMV